MRLFCTSCNENHSFTAREVERIVYALQGAVLVAADREVGWAEETPDCVKITLANSWDVEAFEEWTQANVNYRRDRNKLLYGHRGQRI